MLWGWRYTKGNSVEIWKHWHSVLEFSIATAGHGSDYNIFIGYRLKHLHDYASDYSIFTRYKPKNLHSYLPVLSL